MSQTSMLVSNQDSSRYTTSIIEEPKSRKPSLNKDLNVKENNELKCCCNARDCYRYQRRIIDKDDMVNILSLLRNHVPAEPSKWDLTYNYPRLLLPNPNNDNQTDPFVLQPSLFHRNHVPPVIYFNTKLSELSRPPVGLPLCLQNSFKWKISSITPNSIRNCISFMKFDTIRASNAVDNGYLGVWCKHMLTTEFGQLEKWRKVNHYPGSFHLGRKDKLWFRLHTALQKFGPEEFGCFHPKTFVLPRDYEALCEYWSKSPSNLFIIKPPASARGNGIRVINNIAQIPQSALEIVTEPGKTAKKSTMIVQQYIANPCLLENGQKFDLRVYVLLSSVDPLRIYVYDEGLVRFASSKYTNQEDGIIDQYMHLTNYFINKNNREYQINNDCNSSNGCKWTLNRFWLYLKEHHPRVNTEALWENVIDIIIKTIICCEGPMARLSNQHCKSHYTSYELFGFDIILDGNFKPWILEVNITPSLKSESDLDTRVKYGVIKDMFNIAGYNLPPVSSEEVSDIGNLADRGLFFDSRLYKDDHTKFDKIKHLRYQRLAKNADESKKSTTQVKTDQATCQESEDGIKSSCTDQPDADGQLIEPLRCSNGFQSSPEDEEEIGLGKSAESILDDLTQNDIRILMLSEDELSRCGQFKRVFPSPSSSKYLKYFDRPRYYNLLLDAWEQKYHMNRMEGIIRLSNLANFLN